LKIDNSVAFKEPLRILLI